MEEIKRDKIKRGEERYERRMMIYITKEKRKKKIMIEGKEMPTKGYKREEQEKR